MVVNVLHLFSGDQWAGAEVMISHLLTQLVKDSSLRVEAIALNDGPLTGRLRQAGVHTQVIPESESSFPAILLRARQALRRRRVDVIHSHRYKENVLACLLATMLRRPGLVTTVHGLPESMEPRSIQSLTTRLNYSLLRHCFGRVVAVSGEMAEVLARRYHVPPAKVDVIHNGIPLFPTRAVVETRTRETVHIGTVGRLSPVKDHALFLSIAALVRATCGRARFSILGDGPLKELLARRAAELRLDGALEILPPRPDPLAYYRTLDVFLNTSRHEGMPLSLLEAMACGIPVVAPSVGGIPELVTHDVDGLLVGGRDPQEFARSCLRLVFDRTGRLEMGRRARDTVALRFSVERMAEGYRRIYQHRPGLVSAEDNEAILPPSGGYQETGNGLRVQSAKLPNERWRVSGRRLGAAPMRM